MLSIGKVCNRDTDCGLPMKLCTDDFYFGCIKVFDFSCHVLCETLLLRLKCKSNAEGNKVKMLCAGLQASNICYSSLNVENN